MAALSQRKRYDLAIIGGGATGLGVALDAAIRGLSVVLMESHDFAKGTSSRATKLVHGGVRYLAQGRIGLVYEALHERAAILHNSPHLAQALPFVLPGYKYWQMPFYGAGLKLYDTLAGKTRLGSTEFLSAQQVEHCLPNIRTDGLKGGIQYWDAQFDDARLALALARTAADQGALLINYCRVTALRQEQGRLAGVSCVDTETDIQYSVSAKCVVNATGVWADEIRHQDGAAAQRAVKPMVVPSRGVHLVVDRKFLPGNHALLIPRTRDGRVLFAVPWLGKVILGTTDVPSSALSREPQALPEEVDFILTEAGNYLNLAPSRSDVKSIWAGLRPLVKPPDNEVSNGATRNISREHTILVSPSGLVTVTGGKWTTYRVMAEDVLDRCVAASLLPGLPAGRTADFPLVGAEPGRAPCVGRDIHVSAAALTLADTPGYGAYGIEARWVQNMVGHDIFLCEGLTEAMLRFAVRYEYARTVEDVLARRSRLLFLDASLAASVAPRTAEIMRQELNIDVKLNEFLELARHYRTLPV